MSRLELRRRGLLPRRLGLEEELRLLRLELLLLRLELRRLQLELCLLRLELLLRLLLVLRASRRLKSPPLIFFFHLDLLSSIRFLLASRSFRRFK